MNATVFLVAIDSWGKLKGYFVVDGMKYDDIRVLSEAVGQKHADLAKDYPEPDYSIHVGVADSLPNFLRSFPEITRIRESALLQAKFNRK